ncbi:class II myosin [Tilletia horrida]|uniref:Class II myosin n=1 Tax=Tilletia horrida TaxID=155126 RepID=A0AAN6GNR2_9BASI|nr:class II myosin [Tilletia horrida]
MANRSPLNRLSIGGAGSSTSPSLAAAATFTGGRRVSPATTAADAAAAAEFAEKKWVWLPDKDAGYLPAWVVREEDNGDTSVCNLSDGQIRKVPTDDLSKMNPPKFEKVEDIADLTFLNEASVVHNLRQRYNSGLIYTYSGLFLVAINPYRSLPIYTDTIVAAYNGRRREENAPHVFAIADGAMRSMLDAKENQSLLITGESGAGKTENTKKVIQYLAAIAADVVQPGPSNPDAAAAASTAFNAHQRDASAATGLVRTGSSRQVLDQLRGVEAIGAKRLGLLERQILQANPILEAFGNAQTIRNNNSSRFGKFVRIEFTSLGAIAGANIDWYLLEKSRVTNRSPKERSFHIFYQLIRGADDELQAKLLLSRSPDNYGYLRGTRKDVEGVDDHEEWKALNEAFKTVGFSDEERLNMLRIVAAILHIGNIEVVEDSSEQARITNAPAVEKVCHVLGLPEQELSKALLRPRVKAGREWVTQSRTKKQVTDEMAALCKTMYEKTFASLVERINRALDRPTSKSTFIGVLDIAGFEIFEVNSFEQLCINYTNERLQQFFNHHMFVLEQEEYARENIEWDFVNFGLDLQPTINLIESTNPIGVLSCLDEECIMPKASDVTFTEKLNRIWGTNKNGVANDPMAATLAAESSVAHGSTKFVSWPPARVSQGFTVKHYAGNVEYRTEGWLDKNKDPLNDNLTRVMSESTDRFVAGLFAEYAADDEGLSANTGAVGHPKRRIKRGAFRTVAQRHKEQLSSLMSQLSSTQPHFVRCIVPNPNKKPGVMEVPLVLEQLRCNGVLEGIRIARLGYPNRLLFSEFRNRYEVLTPGIIPQGYMDGRKASQKIVDALELDPSTFKIGTSKIFFKAGILALLEERRDGHLYDVFTRLQAACRMYTARRQMKKILNRAQAVRTIQRNARLYVELREWPWWQLYTKVRPLLQATRHDEELKRKQVELALLKERADRDLKEKEALETLRHSLETEKKKVETELESERALSVDKDALLARSKERESALEEELAALQGDVDLLDSQLERLMTQQKESEASHNDLQAALDAAQEKLMTLQNAQNEWSVREATITADVTKHTEEVSRLTSERAAVESERKVLERKLVEREQDLERLQTRLTASLTEAESKLAAEVRARATERERLSKLEIETRQSTTQLAELSRLSTEHERALKRKEDEIAELKQQLTSASSEKVAKEKEARDLKSKVDTLTFDLKASQKELADLQQSKTELLRQLDETRQLMETKTSEDVKSKEMHRMKEEELQTLRREMSKLQEEHAKLKHSSVEEANALKAVADAARRQHADLNGQHQELLSRSKAHETNAARAEAAALTAEKSQRLAETELKAIRERHGVSEKSLGDLQRAKEVLDKQLQHTLTKQQGLEDAVLELERSSTHYKTTADQLSVELSAESKLREMAESKARSNAQAKELLAQEMAVREKELAKLKDELKQTNTEMRKLQSMQSKTIVEHVHVLEEAKRYTDRQLADAQAKLQELASYTRTLEKSKARLISDNEDLNRQVTQMASVGPAKKAFSGADDTTVKRLEAQVKDLTLQARDAKRERDEAMSASRRKDLQLDDALSRSSRSYEARIAELEREVRNAHAARSNAFANLEDLVAYADPGMDDGSFRRRLLNELRAGNAAMEAEFAAKQDMLRHHKANGMGSASAAKYISSPAATKTGSVSKGSPSPVTATGAGRFR